MTEMVLFRIAAALYGVGTAAYLAHLLVGREDAVRVGRLLTGIGFVVHTAFFLARWAAAGGRSWIAAAAKTAAKPTASIISSMAGLNAA